MKTTSLVERMQNLVTFAPPLKDSDRPRAFAPAGATYPRAAVVPLTSGWWGILIKNHAVDDGHPLLNKEGEVMTFTEQRWAIIHAHREIKAIRARRHPAGQSWLRGGQ